MTSATPTYAAIPPPPASAPATPPTPTARHKKKNALEDRVLVPRTPDEETEDGRIHNKEAVRKIRDTWIYKQVRARQDEFTQYRQVRMLCDTCSNAKGVVLYACVLPDDTRNRHIVFAFRLQVSRPSLSAFCSSLVTITTLWPYGALPFRKHQATLFVGTWNVNAKGKEEALDQWLCADWGPNGDRLPDIVAVGFQEIVDLNAVNVAVDNKTQQRSQFWVERLASTLNNAVNNDPNRRYVLLMQKSMVGLLICVFCKQAHQPRVKYVNAASVGVGVMGMMGNKGGVSIRLQFYDSTLCFVCSHLAAHRENVTGRNADFANVYQKTTFDIGEAAIREVIRSGSLSHWAIGSSSVGLPDHDHTFWLGDLNYRIDESMMTERVLKFSEKGVLDELRHLDQLNIERAGGRAFDGFEEGPLNFPPTYKYQPGTDMYEQRPDKKLRAPAWCDRILWMSQEFSHVRQLTYARSESPNVSDHKAVYSTMIVTIKDVIQAKREAIYDELLALLDRYENQTLPMVGLDRVNLDFGEIRYDESLTLPIHITNTGSVVAQFRFVPKPEEVGIAIFECALWKSN